MRALLACLAAAVLAACLPARAQSVGHAVAPAAKSVAAPAAFVAPGLPIAARFTLPAPEPALIASVRESNARSMTKRVEIGIGREVDAGGASALAAARWHPVRGGRVARWEVASASALGLRLAIGTAGLGEGIELRLAGSARPDLVHGPFTAGRMREAGAAWWSPVLAGDTAIVEWFVAGTAREPAPELARISHVFVDPADPKAGATAKAAGACEVNLVCRSALDPALAQAGRAIARLVITRSTGGSILCTGNLLNATDGSLAPYLATANHCISTPAEAASLQTDWFYETTTCTGTTQSPALATVTGGATLLFTNVDSDFTLVRMNQSPPAGAVFAGWDAATVTAGTAVTAVHHPDGDVKKVSLGAIAGFEASGLGIAGSFIRVQWNSTQTGVVEGGSSGGGIFTNGGAGYRFRGGLNGGASDCTVPPQLLYDWYSRFDLAYPFVAQWLNPAGAPALAPNSLGNPGFESGTASWQQASTTSTSIVTNDPGAAHGGSWYAWLGGALDVTESLSQTVTIPQGPARLQFWYRISTAETSANREFDRLAISITNATGSATLATLGTLTNLNATPGWVQSPVYDVSAFAGQAVRLQFRATNDFSAVTSFLVDDVTLTTLASVSTANQTSLWWNPAESGWGLNANQQGNTAFATLFTYDSAGAPMWLVMSNGARQAGGDVFVGPLYRTNGPPFNANPFVPIGPANIAEVGSMTLDFSASGATIGYAYNDTYVSKRIQKQPIGAHAAACQDTTASRAGATNFQDLWWNPAESGWGINLAHQGDTIFATLFTYATNGQGMWLVMPEGRRQADGSFSGALYRTQGPAFNAQPWFAINFASVGTMRLRFANGETGTLEYSVDGASVSKAITRQVFGTPVPLCSS
jgi:hypothetical protein